MKRITLLLLTVSYLALSAGVSCAKVKTPAFTERIEKAVLVKETATNGAFTFTIKPAFTECTFVGVLKVNKIYWCVDETFFAFRYKAKLSDAVEEINAPPDNKNIYSDIPFKVSWRG